jgi:hypothetical protein
MDEGARQALVGTWVVDPLDTASLEEFGEQRLVFEPDGHLVVTATEPDKVQYMLLTWRVDGQWLITDQPSMPREEHAEFMLVGGDRLTLVRGGLISHFIRVSPGVH